MQTLRLDFHMGRVEWVTCQVPESHAGMGAVKEEGCGRWVEVVGGRREMLGRLAVMMGVQLDDSLSVSSFAENGRWKPTEGAPGGGGWKAQVGHSSQAAFWTRTNPIDNDHTCLGQRITHVSVSDSTTLMAQ